MTKETVGKISSDLSQKAPETRDPIELEREMHKDYEKNIMECIERGKKEIIRDPFYVCVETKKEKLMQNVIRNYFFFRRSCPTPTTDQTVYYYNQAEDSIKFLWVIPSQDSCNLLMENALQVDPEEQELLRYVMDFKDGTLLKKAKELNGEKADSILIEK